MLVAGTSWLASESCANLTTRLSTNAYWPANFPGPMPYRRTARAYAAVNDGCLKLAGRTNLCISFVIVVGFVVGFVVVLAMVPWPSAWAGLREKRVLGLQPILGAYICANVGGPPRTSVSDNALPGGSWRWLSSSLARLRSRRPALSTLRDRQRIGGVRVG
jgi:hypothetical protein